MATIRLIPSTYYSSSSYLTVSSADNMYANTDSTTYCTVTNTRSGTSSYYIYIRGFNFDDVPSDATVNSITIKIKAYHSGGNTSTIGGYNDTTSVSSAGTTTALETSATVQTFTGTTIEWDTLKSYGDDFGIRINCRRSNRNTTAYFYIYGAEIVVDYSLPVYHTVSSSTTIGTISPSGSTSVVEGDDFTLTISANNPSIIDNNTDVTSQLVRVTGGTSTYTPYDYTSTGYSVSDISNAYTDISSSTRASLSLSGRTTGNIYLDLGPVNLPSSATISSVSCQASLGFSRNGSSSSVTASCQLYAGNTAKGSSTTVVSSATDLSQTTFTLTPGSWSASELANARFYLTTYNGASSTVRYMYIYGVSLSVTYTVSGEVYTYTISNVVTDHTIVVSAGSTPTAKVYIKINGAWVQYSKIYKKVNGSWVQQSDITNVFQSGTDYKWSS